MRGNSHVQFSGEGAAATPPPYPTPGEFSAWPKPAESIPWYLDIASQPNRDVTLDQGERQVLRVAGRVMDPDLDPPWVKLIPSDTPLARAALEIHRRSPGPRPSALATSREPRGQAER
jgi:hypothetical protein